ncbi:MAG TPA: carboxypeptidase regulatory-like domain-containing protein [Verrucomicrobiae bacterium]|nr:carboxypeptidase regulatory-like domain-containing protein [Verrucomicrobiae bacterium]
MSVLTTLKMISRCALATGLLLALPLIAQEYRATITGTVTDPSGAPVPNVQVDARNIETSTTLSARTNESGIYTIPFVLPGIYNVTATVQGFKQAIRENVELHAGDKVQTDLKLEVGASSDKVTVTAESEQLRTATASMGQTINRTETTDLPMMGRNTYMFAELATGISTPLSTTSQASGFGRPYDGAAAQMSAEGIGAQYQIMLNGIPNAPEERASGAIYVGFVPSPDAVEEVTVQTHMYDAQYGHSSGPVVNAVLKGGTNNLHGSVYEFFRNNLLNANSFNANAASQARGVMRWNQPGFVVDGPVFIPKVYNGKDKTFFMFSMEWIRNASPLPYTASYPTAAERKGDFSSLVNANGQPVIIYDPKSTLLTNGQYLRTPIPNNIIPASLINPIGQNLINDYPLPNIAGTAGGFNNYVVSPNSQQDKYHSLSSRVDHQLNAKNRLSFMGFSNVRHQLFPDYGWANPAASPGYLHFRNNHGGSIDWTDSLSPTMVLDVKAGAIFHPFQVGLYGDNYDITKLGFPAAVAAQMPHLNYPGLSIGNGFTGSIGNAGTGTPTTSQYTTTLDQTLSATVSKVIGKHTLKFGGEGYEMKANNNTPVSNLNSFSFNSTWTQQNAQSSSQTAGNPWASLLLGWPAGGGYSITIANAFEQVYTGYFIQDDIRLTSRLTINLGLRWEYESPMTERYNRQNDGWAFNTNNPIGVSVNGQPLQGGLLFTSSSNRYPFKKDLNNWGPRVGASYRLFNNTVLRGGFGTNYSVTFQTGGNTGFSQNTSMITTNDAGLTPANSLSSPFPTGILPATGSNLGLATSLGQGITFADPDRTIPKVYNYSLAIEQLLPYQTLVEVAFAGNYASQLSVSKSIDFLPRSFYALPGNPIPVPSTTLLAQVANPMAGLIPGSSLNNATVAYQTLQMKYPEFSNVTESTVPIGSSLYNSMQISVEKRLSKGLQGRFSFTWDKILQQTGYLNSQDDFSNLTRGQSGEPTKIMDISLTYQLPIFAASKGLLHNVLGGWEANTIVRYLNGSLVGAPGGVYSTGINPKLSNPTYSQWFDTCTLNTSGVRQNCANASQPVAFIQLPPYTLGTLDGLPGIRTQVPTTLDFSLFKAFQVHEKMNLQFRANAYNLCNTAIFGAPNSTTGVIGIGQVNDPRIVELALKLNF